MGLEHGDQDGIPCLSNLKNPTLETPQLFSVSQCYLVSAAEDVASPSSLEQVGQEQVFTLASAGREGAMPIPMLSSLLRGGIRTSEVTSTKSLSDQRGQGNTAFRFKSCSHAVS